MATPTLFDLTDQLDSQIRTARTLQRMMYGLTSNEDGPADELIDENHADSRTQRMFACLEALEAKLDALSQLETQIRSFKHDAAQAA